MCLFVVKSFCASLWLALPDSTIAGGVRETFGVGKGVESAEDLHVTVE